MIFVGMKSACAMVQSYETFCAPSDILHTIEVFARSGTRLPVALLHVIR